MKNYICKTCNGTGKIPTYEKQDKFCGIDFSGPKFKTCPKCFGAGRYTIVKIKL
jgi:DnaJ-class molecular chaperone